MKTLFDVAVDAACLVFALILLVGRGAIAAVPAAGTAAILALMLFGLPVGAIVAFGF